MTGHDTERINKKDGYSDANGRVSLNSVFGEKLVGTRIPTIATQFQYGLRIDDAKIDIVGSGNFVLENAMLKIRTGTDVDGHIGVQGADYLRYIPGNQAYFHGTWVFATPTADSRQRFGLFDNEGDALPVTGNGDQGNGFFFGFDGVTFGITRRRNGVDDFIEIDISKVLESGDFDPTLGNVYTISYAYLGFAPISFEIMNPDGSWKGFAKIEYPNTSKETHIANSNLPIRGEITNTGNTTNLEGATGSVTAGIVDGGGADPMARWFSFQGPTTILTAATPTELITFRNKTDFFNIKNKITSQLMLMAAATEGNKPVKWKFLKNPTITTPGTFADADVDSVIEVSFNEVHDLATGTVLLAWNMAKADSFFEKLGDLLIKLRPEEYAVLIAESTLANDVDYSIRYRDLF